MVHLRISEKEPNPNMHINFITVLPGEDKESARQLLRALAAQVRPIMKMHGLSINSFEEYEWNRVFGGRNWNAGETIEIVLRAPDGMFLSASWLLNVVCHELAHIKHMNHSKAFHSLWASLRSEVLDLQKRGYYGDGYWSSGQQLTDSANVGGDGLEATEFPEYLCGGAQTKSRPTSLKRRRLTKRKSGPSNHTGAQTSKKPKAGTRVKKDFGGEGVALNEGLEKDKGIGFRKKARSNRAREERALAAEKRMLALQKSSQKVPESDSTTESDLENEGGHWPAEQDDDRRRIMLEAMQDGDADVVKAKTQNKIEDYTHYFRLPPSTFDRNASAGPSCHERDTIDLDSTTANGDFGCDIQPLSATSSSASAVGSMSRCSNPTVKSELSTFQVAGKTTSRDTDKQPGTEVSDGEWNCRVCTLSNNSNYLACDACGTTKGDVQWKAPG